MLPKTVINNINSKPQEEEKDNEKLPLEIRRSQQSVSNQIIANSLTTEGAKKDAVQY